MNCNSGQLKDDVSSHSPQWLRIMGDWATHPMFTEPVSSQQADDFALLIGTRLLSRDQLTDDTNRSTYLAPAIKCNEHVFLDPDTGIRLKPTRGKKAPFYIFGPELIEIVQAHSNMLVMVFDQSLARGSERHQLQKKLQSFSTTGIHSVAYVSHACFVVSSN